MRYPIMRIFTDKIEANGRRLIKECANNGISVWAVTKGMSAQPEIARVFKKAGFDVSYVIGEAGNDLHIWNKIKLGEDNYYIDTTWASKDKAKRYEYFLIDANSLSKTHTWK